MKRNAIIFVDVDDADIPRYNYRKPHFIAAKNRGWVCLTLAVKHRKNLKRLTEDSDKVCLIDDLSYDELKQVISKINQTYNVKAIFCHSGHATLMGQVGTIVAALCEYFGLHHASAQAIDCCNNKFLMRENLRKNGIENIRFSLCDNLEILTTNALRMGFPLIAKPPFGAGSAFVKKCINMEQLIEHYKIFCSNYSSSLVAEFLGPVNKGVNSINNPGATILLEEYIDGIEGSVECILTEEGIYPLIINEKLILTEENSTILENLLITPPVSFSAEDIKSIKHHVVACIQNLGLYNAIAHVEFRMTKDGPKIIEINPRLGGLYVNSSFQDIYNINPYDTYLSILSNQDNVDEEIKNKIRLYNETDGYFSMLAIYPDHRGIFKGFTGTDYLKENICVIAYEQYPADTYVDSNFEEYYLLKCWLKTQGEKHTRELYDEILTHVKAIIMA